MKAKRKPSYEQIMIHPRHTARMAQEDNWGELYFSTLTDTTTVWLEISPEGSTAVAACSCCGGRQDFLLDRTAAAGFGRHIRVRQAEFSDKIKELGYGFATEHSRCWIEPIAHAIPAQLLAAEKVLLAGAMKRIRAGGGVASAVAVAYVSGDPLLLHVGDVRPGMRDTLMPDRVNERERLNAALAQFGLRRIVEESDGDVLGLVGVMHGSLEATPSTSPTGPAQLTTILRTSTCALSKFYAFAKRGKRRGLQQVGSGHSIGTLLDGILTEQIALELVRPDHLGF